MKKPLIFFSIIFALLITITIYYINKADYHGKLAELNETENTFLLYRLKSDPEAEYNVPVIKFDDKTIVDGNVNKIEYLSNGQEVKVWTEQSEGLLYARKIKVIN
ncbi:MAG: hypothetical protein LPK00_03925 [Bacillaceae bacterium]|nr:hypothetical protein [Bacillaceae bacterium]